LDSEGVEDHGILKMEHFKRQCRAILGPSKRVERGLLLDEEEYLEELYQGSSGRDGGGALHYTTSEGKKIMVNKEYANSMEIVAAYKSLKQAVSKAAPTYMAGMVPPSSRGGGERKGYLKMTIAA
jgi:hypothetical protein